MLLEGRVALVTGASRGIGAGIARAFAAQGATLVLCARGEGVEALAEELSTPEHPARAMRGDVNDPAFTRGLIAASRKEYGHLDVLVNNAGILRQGLIGMTSAEHVREMLEVNVVALIALTQYATRAMDGRRSPSIVNLASITGTQGMAGVTGYAASKAAVVGYTLSSAKELAPKGIRVNAIAPGFFHSRLADGAIAMNEASIKASSPIPRVGEAGELKGVAVFLAADASNYITGQTIVVDGGRTIA
jgi:3-oxoacyl-[acyl-carrier protein] reductase